MTIDLRTHLSLPQWFPWKQLITPGSTFYCLLLDSGSVYEHQTLQVSTVAMVRYVENIITSKTSMNRQYL